MEALTGNKPKKTDIRMIALDLDGTLLTSDKELTERSRAALEAAAEKGILIVPATGRFYAGMPKAVRDLSIIRYAVTINGALVLDIKTRREVCSATVPTEEALEFYSYLDTLPVIYDCYVDEWGYMTAWMHEAAGEYISNIHSLKMVKELRTPVPELKAWLKEGGHCPQKMQLFTKNDPVYRDELLGILSEKFPQFAVSTSLPNNIEINIKGADKGLALAKLAEHCGMAPSQIMAFGDGLNDITMLKTAGIGVAMENAHPLVKEAADLTTDSCDRNGVAAVIEELLKNS